jgi:hypothetical protein
MTNLDDYPDLPTILALTLMIDDEAKKEETE